MQAGTAVLTTEAILAESANSATPIQVRVENVSQLFDTLDPYPFPERDLDKDASSRVSGACPFLLVSHSDEVALPGSSLILRTKSIRVAVSRGDATLTFYSA